MSMIQFLRILWAHRLIPVLTTGATLIGATIAVLVIPPSYEGTTRVMLNVLKPDPVTGEVVANANARTYVTTQTELIKDVGVAGQAVESLGWLSDPEAIRGYGANVASDGDLRRALAQRIIDRTRVEIVPGTNILAISFRAPSANEARAMANALREAYVATTLENRRRDAARNADWFIQQAAKERELLSKADAAKTAFEKEAGIVMQDEKVDIETARLRALALQAGVSAPVMAAPAPQSSAASLQLAQLDAQLAQASRTLGPNHPTMVQMREQRAQLAKIAAQDEAAGRQAAAAAARAVQASSGALESAVRRQTERVIANRDKIEKLNELQVQVNLHREQLDKSLARAGELRQEAAVADSGVTLLSEAVTPKDPAFPKKPLIFGGALALGAGLGLLLALIIELVSRRVRGADDLANALDVPLLAVISTSQGQDNALTFASLTGFGRRGRRDRRMAPGRGVAL